MTTEILTKDPTEAELEAMAQAWRDWSTEPDAWFAVLHGEILCRV